MIGLTAINDNGVRASMAGKRLAQEVFGRRQVSVLASLGVGKSRCWLKKNATVSPTLSMARYRYIHLPRTFM